MAALDLIDEWPVRRSAVAMVAPDGSTHARGDTDHEFPLTSVTKLATALAVLVAVEEGSITLDHAVTDAGATVSDLLAHVGGMAPDSQQQIAAPRTRRVYSNSAYDRLGALVSENTEIAFGDYLREAVLEPLGMTATELRGSPGADAVGTVRDLIALANAWRHPLVVHETTLDRATAPILPELGGVLPGFGHHEPNPWGLGPEIRGDKSPHWTGSSNSARTFGHFGRSGTMLWIDPVADMSLIALTDEPFGPWAATAWPRLSDAVLDEG